MGSIWERAARSKMGGSGLRPGPGLGWSHVANSLDGMQAPVVSIPTKQSLAAAVAQEVIPTVKSSSAIGVSRLRLGPGGNDGIAAAVVPVIPALHLHQCQAWWW